MQVGDLLSAGADAVVSPGNSFGDMGGGVDRAIDLHYEGLAQAAARDVIRERWLGELPVGAAELVYFDRADPRYLVLAPTMRVPGNVATTINAYLATRAALVCVTRANQRGIARIEHLAMTGMCSGVGGMRPGRVADQMATAIGTILDEGWRRVEHPALAPYVLKG